MKLARLVVCLLAACSHPAAPATPVPPPAPPKHPVTISVIGTNDVHGALERLPLFAGFVANLRAARAADGGGVVLLDGGDMFQGTLESNLGEGADMVRAYNAIGYTAAAVGNHEFDYGPVGPAAVPGAGEDPRGALKARASEAKFPFVVSNIVEAATSKRISYPNMPASVLVEVAGIKIGIVGASTRSTPYTTMPANFAGLQIAPPASAIAEQARALRGMGAQVVFATMHIGSACRKFDDPNDASSCEKREELFTLLADLPKGLVDVIVAGHTHAMIAHRLEGIAVIESGASGRAFGRIDLTFDAQGKLGDVRIDKPHLMCALDERNNPVPVSQCAPGDYEGKPVVPDPEIQKIVDGALARAGERRKEKLGVTLAGIVTRAHGTESAEGNLFTDLMRAARPDTQVAMTNGGGLRADLPAGELTYGQLFEAMPFDNRFAIIDVSGRELRALVVSNLERGGAFLSWSGLSARARCKGDALDLQITVGAKPLDDNARYKLATSDFLASGGDGIIARVKIPENQIAQTDAVIRDSISDVLRSWRGTPKAAIDPAKLFSPTARRIDYQGRRPVECGAPKAQDKETSE